MTVYDMQTHFHPQSTGTVAATSENLSPSGDLVSESIVNATSNGNGGIPNAFSSDSHSTLSNTCSDYSCDNSNPSTNVDDLVATKDSLVVTSAAGDATSVATSRAALPLMGTDTQTQVSCPSSMNAMSRDQVVLQNHQLPQQSSNQTSQQQNTSQQSQLQPTSLTHVHSQQPNQSPQNQQMHPNTSQSQLISQQHFQHHSDHHQSIQQVRQHQDLQQGQTLSQPGQLPSFAEITGGNIGSPSQYPMADMLCPLDMDTKGSFRSMSHLQNQHQPNVHSQANSIHNMQLPVNTFANASQSSSLSPSSTSVANQQVLSYATSLMKEMSLKDATTPSSGGQTTASPGQYHMQNANANGFFGRTGGDPLNSFFPNDGLGRSMDKPDAKLAATSVLWSNTGPDIGSGNITAPGLQGVGFPSGNCTNNNTSFFNAGGEVGMPSQQGGGPPHSHHQQAQYAISSVYPGSKRAITGGHNLMASHHGGRSTGSTQFGGSGNMMSGGGGGTGRHFTGGGGHTGGSRNYSGSNIWTLALQNQRMGNPPAPMNVIGAALNVQGANSNTANSTSNNSHGGRSGGGGASYPNMFSKRHRPLPPHKQYELTNAVAATATNPSCIEPSFSELSPAGGPHSSLSGLTTPDGGPASGKGFESLGKFGPTQHQTPQSQSAVENVQFYEDLFRGAGFDGHTAANFMSTNFMNATGSFEGDMTASHIPSAAAALPGYLNPGIMPNNMGGGPPQAREERYSRKVFVGGLPPDIDEEEITNAFRRFGPLVVDWPHKAESKTFFPPKGYCFLLFQDEMSVQHLIEACVVEDQKYYWCVSSPTMKDKAVQIRPWNLADSDYVMDGSQPLDPRKTIFVGGVPRPLRALELAMIMDRLYGGVCYAGIDTDPELKYPKGAGRVAFSNQQSYIAAISARFVQLQHNDIDKRVEVKPYVLDDQMCDECQGSRCQGKFAPFFCANVMCLQYYCEQCWAHIHSRPGREFHKPLVKEGADRPRTMNFRW